MKTTAFQTIILLFLTFSGQLFAQNEQNSAKKINILAVGDSNGAHEKGWVYQLQQIRSTDVVINSCVSGNTIGFDNLGREKLNTLKNIDSYISKAVDSVASIDIVIVMLGTNDCKAVFDKQQKKVPANLTKLIEMIKTHKAFKNKLPEIVIVTPPPYGPKNMLIEKYLGAPGRVKSLIAKFKKAAKTNNCPFIDIYTPLLPVIKYITSDGVHLIPEGQKIVALIINEYINNK